MIDAWWVIVGCRLNDNILHNGAHASFWRLLKVVVHKVLLWAYFVAKSDAPPYSLKDWNACPKVKKIKAKGVGVRSPTCIILGVEGHVRTPGCGLGQVISGQLFTRTCINQTTSWLMCSWNTFGAWTSHGHTWTSKIHHIPNLGEVTTFPLIIFSMISHKGYIQMSFCLGTLELGVFENFEIGIPATLEAHNFLFIFFFEVMFEAKL